MSAPLSPSASRSVFTPAKAWLAVVLIWAGIYLPGLGRMEFQGEEGRRVLPAVAMLETGNWIVPQIGGEFYFRKPPLINWLVAGSFEIIGERSELAARLPSVVFVLMFATLLIWLPVPFLNLEARFTAALVFLTNISMLEKGRLIEIEAIYISLTGMATVLWLHSFASGALRWRGWLPASAMLGLGMLLKGPIILPFFYVPVLAVLWRSKRLRELVSIPAVAGVIVWLGGFLIWIYLVLQQASGEDMSSTWAHELKSHTISPTQFELGKWFVDILNSFKNFLPWLLLAPLLWCRAWTGQIPERWLPLFRSLRLAMAGCFVVVVLLPGSMPRYSLPILPLFCLLLGWVLPVSPVSHWSSLSWQRTVLALLVMAGVAGLVGLGLSGVSLLTVGTAVLTVLIALSVLRWHHWFATWPRIALATGILAASFILLFNAHGVQRLESRRMGREVALQLDQAVPKGATLHVFRPYMLSMLLYVKTPIQYVLEPKEIGSDVRYLLVRKTKAQGLMNDPLLLPREPKILATLQGPRVEPCVLLELRSGLH